MDEYQSQKEGVLTEEGIEVPFELLHPDTLDQFIREYVMREGTDYGYHEVSFDTKVNQVRRQIEAGDLKVVFDLASQTGTLQPTQKISINGSKNISN